MCVLSKQSINPKLYTLQRFDKRKKTYERHKNARRHRRLRQRAVTFLQLLTAEPFCISTCFFQVFLHFCVSFSVKSILYNLSRTFIISAIKGLTHLRKLSFSSFIRSASFALYFMSRSTNCLFSSCNNKIDTSGQS